MDGSQKDERRNEKGILLLILELVVIEHLKDGLHCILLL